MRSSELDLHVPSGALTQVRTVCPMSPCTSPVRRSRTWPDRSLPDAGVADAQAAAERQQRPGLLAADEDRDADVARRLDVGDAEADGPAGADLGVAACR